VRTALVGLFFVLVGTALAIFQGLRISRPIKMLAWRADQIARGDLETRVEISSGDEIGMLGENFNYMADRLLILMRETAEKATLEKELEVARTIQETLVPPPDPVEREYVKLAGYFLPASQCGGDWWTVHDMPDGRILVVIGDVTGHGVPSAMITAAAKAACDVVRATEGDKLTVTRLLEVMNRAIFESAKRKFVMTCFASILDPKKRTITYANAGHNFPYLFRPGAVDGNDFQVLMSRGNRLGDLEESTYSEKTAPLNGNDVLVWYTDGIVECENDRGEEYGEKRFRAAIRRAAELDPVAMRESVVSAAGQFFGDRPRKDDITMVFARIAS
jgi:serine phosphatase RsbU (regulator of sigma subunit)